MTDKIKVIITGYERVQYHQYREIDVATWNKFQAMVVNKASEMEFEQLAELLIDRADVLAGDGIEDFDIQIDDTDTEDEEAAA